MIVEIDNKWRIEVDNYGNHEPLNYRTIEKRNGTKVEEWVKVGKFFPNVGQAIKWIISQEVLLGVDTVQYQEYLDKHKELVDYYGEKIGR